MSHKQLKKMIMAIVLVTLLSSQSSAQQPSCAPPMVSLSPCISYLIGNSSMPSSLCCSVIATIADAQTPCLCSMLNGSVNQLEFIVNATQAITGLPGACSIPGPSSAGQCSGVSSMPSPTPSSSTSLPTAVSPAMSTKGPSPSTAGTGNGSRTTDQCIFSFKLYENGP